MILPAIALVVLIFFIAVLLFLRGPQFGRPASGERLERIRQSPNYKNGQFQNQHPTPALTEGANYYSMLREFFFHRNKRVKPARSLPSKKTDLLALASGEDVLVWFGHSSYFIQIDGKKILVDPVLSGHASPIAATTRSFPGSDVYTAEDIPVIDYLFITHDHYDHLDYDTMRKLKPRIKKIITGLGVGAHLERWGYNKDIIIENDWNEALTLDNGFIVHTVPARHFSGRAFKRNISLWLSFVLQTPTMKLFIGGDSGYDSHFADIGRRFGPFDLAILENGQYDKNWKYIHMMPEETVQAAQDLQAKKLFPVHWAKFALSVHAWDDPVIRVSKEALHKNVPLLYPMIGETLLLKGDNQDSTWWETF